MAILIVTSMDFGGLTEILKIANDGGRFPNQFEFDPRYRQGIHEPLLRMDPEIWPETDPEIDRSADQAVDP